MCQQENQYELCSMPWRERNGTYPDLPENHVLEEAWWATKSYRVGHAEENLAWMHVLEKEMAPHQHIFGFENLETEELWRHAYGAYRVGHAPDVTC